MWKGADEGRMCDMNIDMGILGQALILSGFRRGGIVYEFNAISPHPE